MNSVELRKKFVEFYISKKHKEIGAASLLAENDPTLLFVNSGMFPLVPYLLGEIHPAGNRLVNYQRSFRTDDIDEVGDRRHTTFFEMLGNWSLGDYFKKEQLSWWYEFLIEVLNLDPARIYQSVFAGDNITIRDDETINILLKIFDKYGVNADIGPVTIGDGCKGSGVNIDFNRYKIFPYVDKNWWKRGDSVGELGGPDSETFYDTGLTHNPKYGKFCHVNCDCGRFIEIGNSVFMQYKKTQDGWDDLSQKNVDFGGGLERLVMVCNGLSNIFKTDLFDDYVKHLEKKANRKYEELPASFEIIADHVRATTFLIADGCLPSNKDQGYFVRRLIRRSLIHSKKLEINFNVFSELAELVIKKMTPIYPHLAKYRKQIIQNISNETDKFSRAIKNGIKYFEKFTPENGNFSNNDIFNLVTTYGLPLDLIKELAQEKGLTLDEAGFHQVFEAHQALSRAGSEQKFKGGLADHSEQTTKLHTVTHLLHQALRIVLGTHVQQKGSNINAERLRFDFSHPEKMTSEQLQKVEEVVNEQIKKKLPVHVEELTVDESKKSGALGFFENKYGEKVKVYTIGKSTTNYFSKEICGGPHVQNIKELHYFKILKEEASSAGVRRIKAILEQKNE